MLEELVRPFQSPAVISSRRIVTSNTKAPLETAHLEWGKSGALPSAIETAADQPAQGINFNTKKEDQHLKEKTRETERVKVQQEGNPDNYVVIERVKSVSFANAGKEPEVRVKGTGAGSTTTPVAPPSGDGGGGGDIPVTRSGEFAFVRGQDLAGPAGDIYLQTGDRRFEFVTPPPGPNEVPL
jgi:hypothetical protein